jgi:hypothetical protein
MNMDTELVAWRTEWLADEPAPRADLRALVRRETRRMQLAFAGQLLYGLSALVFTAWFAFRRPTFEWILWAAVVWIAAFFATGFAIWNKAGTWNALQQSNTAFLDLSLRRCRRELQAIHAGRWALAVQLAIVMIWFSIDLLLHRFPAGAYLFGVALNGLVGAVYLIVFAARERRIAGDLENLRAIERNSDI